MGNAVSGFNQPMVLQGNDYLARNPDVAADPYFSKRPWVHYQRHGAGEGRSWLAPAKQVHAPSGSAPKQEPVEIKRPAPPPPPPELNLPGLQLSKDASVVHQLNKLQSQDSLLMQQALVNAHEKGVASGAIHSSQQGGAAQKALTDQLQPLAASEANKEATEEIQNWQSEVTKRIQQWEKAYAERLQMLGFEHDKAKTMALANTQLSQTLISSVTSLLNNPEIEYGQGVQDKLTGIINTAQDNNNVILGMGFKY